MKIAIYNLKAENVGEMTLPKIFATEKSDKLLTQAIRVFLNNQRKSHAKAKDRGDIAGTSAKMWPQKGTGRARHSTKKAPQFVGGASAHGPSGEQNFKLKLPKSQRKLALYTILSKFAKEKRIIAIEKIDTIEPKTKVAVKLITGLNKHSEEFSKSRRIGIVTQKSFDSVRRAFGNLPGFELLNLNSLNVYELSRLKFIIFQVEAINDIK